MKDLIISHFSRATTAQIVEGMRWYQDARAFCLDISRNRGLPLWRVVGVLAALSPRNKWERNKQDALNLIELQGAATVSTFGNNKALALRILREADLKPVDMVNVLGQKVFSFYSNILYQGDEENVTVDVWAMRSVGFTGSLTEKRYKEIRDAYIGAAKQLRIKPYQLQAIVWGVVRGKAS